MRIKDLAPRLAYLRGYYRGRVTGYEMALREILQEIDKKSQLNLNLVDMSDQELRELIARLG